MSCSFVTEDTKIANFVKIVLFSLLIIYINFCLLSRFPKFGTMLMILLKNFSLNYLYFLQLQLKRKWTSSSTLVLEPSLHKGQIRSCNGVLGLHLLPLSIISL